MALEIGHVLKTLFVIDHALNAKLKYSQLVIEGAINEHAQTITMRIIDPPASNFCFRYKHSLLIKDIRTILSRSWSG